MTKQMIITALNVLLDKLETGTINLEEYILVEDLIDWYENNCNTPVPWEEHRIETESTWEMCGCDDNEHGITFRTFGNVLHMLREGGFEIETRRTYYPMPGYKYPRE